MPLVYITGPSGAGKSTVCAELRRLATRAGFGCTAADLRRILQWHATLDADNARYGAVLIDGSDPVAQVVDKLLIVLDVPNTP